MLWQSPCQGTSGPSPTYIQVGQKRGEGRWGRGKVCALYVEGWGVCVLTLAKSKAYL